MFRGVQISGDFSTQANLNNLFGQMKDILKTHAPEEELSYESKGLHPMVSVDQAAKELLELLKNEANAGK